MTTRNAPDTDGPSGEPGARDGRPPRSGSLRPDSPGGGHGTGPADGTGAEEDPGLADRVDTPGEPEIRWRWVWLGWAAVAVVFAGQNVVGALASGADVDWGWAVYHELLYWGVWAALTPLIFRQARTHPLGGDAGWRPWAAHAALALVIAPAHIAAAYLLHGASLVALGPLPAPELAGWLTERRVGFLVITVTGLWKYAAVVGVFYAFDYSRRWRREQEQSSALALRAARLEGRLARTKLDALRSQLRPHFLFNTLNSITVLTREAPEQAEATLRRLSGLLRETLAGEAAEEVPLDEELDFLERYLEIQKIRYEDRLRVEMEVEPGVRRLGVPFLILQPAVENAVEHGVDRRPQGATVTVRAWREAGRLELRVEDRAAAAGTGARGGRDRPTEGADGAAGAGGTVDARGESDAAPSGRGRSTRPGDPREALSAGEPVPAGAAGGGSRGPEGAADGAGPASRTGGETSPTSPAEDERSRDGGGTGLANVRERLEQLYGDDHRFEACPGRDEAFVVRISIPAREPDARARGHG